MSVFSLSRRNVFPAYVQINGVECGIDADFRNILRIFRVLEDGEMLERHKYELLRRFFFIEGENEGGSAGTRFGGSERGVDCGGERPSGAESIAAFAEFIANSRIDGTDAESDAADGGLRGEKRFDFEFDAAEIYQSFYGQYGIDLCETKFLHFYKFMLLLAGLSSDIPFVGKLRTRFMDLRGLKGAELIRMRELKERAQLPVKHSKEELREIEEFERIWGGTE